MVEPQVGTGIESGPLSDPSDAEIRARLETRAQRRRMPREERVAQSVAPKRILLIHRWFWPDTPPYASMLRSIGRQLVDDGYEVTVLTAQPSYHGKASGPARPEVEELDGMTIVRLKQWKESKGNWIKRGLNMLRFMWQLRRFILRRARTEQGVFDAIMATTMPPVLVAATARRAARRTGASFLYHMMDIYPEIAWVSGLAKRNLLTRWLAKVDARNCREADRVVVLSRDMKSALEERGLVCGHVVIQNNFRLESFPERNQEGEPVDLPAVPPIEKKPGEFRVLFAGNLGRFQGLDEVVAVVREMVKEQPDLHLHFLGEGVRRFHLEEMAGDHLGHNIHFHGHVPAEVAAAWTASADFSLITLQPEIIRYAYPSKTAACLCAASAVIAMVERDSELGHMIRDEDLGFVTPFGDRVGLRRALLFGLENPERLRSLQANAFRVGQERFEPAEILPRWTEMYRRLLGS